MRVGACVRPGLVFFITMLSDWREKTFLKRPIASVGTWNPNCIQYSISKVVKQVAVLLTSGIFLSRAVREGACYWWDAIWRWRPFTVSRPRCRHLRSPAANVVVVNWRSRMREPRCHNVNTPSCVYTIIVAPTPTSRERSIRLFTWCFIVNPLTVVKLIYYII